MATKRLGQWLIDRGERAGAWRRPSVQRALPWRLAVPVVCLLAGVLLAATRGVAGGDEIRGGDAPRLADMVRDTRTAVDALSTERERLTGEVSSVHGRFAGTALAAMAQRTRQLHDDAAMPAQHGPGLVVTLTDAQRDAEGQFPRDASPDDLVVHQKDIDAVLNALWTAGAEAIQVQDQRIVGTLTPRCVGNTLLLGGRTYSPPYIITALGDPAALQAGLAASPGVVLYRQYVVRFGLGYGEQVRADAWVAAGDEPTRMRYATPAGPVDY